MKLEELEAKEREIVSALNAIRGEIREERLKIAKDKYGVDVGSVVVNNNGVRFLVVEIEAKSFLGKPWLSGNPEKKDGTWSKAVRNLFNDWDIA